MTTALKLLEVKKSLANIIPSMDPLLRKKVYTCSKSCMNLYVTDMQTLPHKQMPTNIGLKTIT